MSIDKRTIKVGLLPEQTEDYSQYEESEFNWGRIIFAASLALAIVIILIYSLLNDDDEALINKLDAVDRTAHGLNNSNLDTSSTKEQENNQTVFQATTPSPAKSASLVKVAEAKSQKSDDAPLVKQSAEKEESPLINTVTTNTKVETKTSPKTQKKKSAPQQTQVNTHAIKTVSTVKILDAHIKKAQLSSNLIKGLPVDTLSSRILMSDEGIIRVHLYTEMENLRGQNLYHNWYRDGEKQARVRIPVNHNNQRSSSSKFINKQMLGKWAVQVLDEQGKAYIEVKFEVVKP
ncbi:MAG: hypothetical protein ACI9T9_000127 [Oleiphilaceae bacterium]|jgi:hypothetical protein